MANDIPSGTTQFLIAAANDQTFILEDGNARSATGTDPAIFVDGASHNDTLILKGHVEQTDNANEVVLVSGVNIEVHLTKTGSSSGIGGFHFDGVNATMVNAGTIDTTGMNSDGISSESANASITNTGTITTSTLGGDAIFTNGDDTVINNNGKLVGSNGIDINLARTTIDLGAKSEITATSAGIFGANNDAADTISITNHGTITGQGLAFAIQLQASDDVVVNQGTMTGRIFLGAGQDLFDNRGGTVDHVIEGSLGDDTLITDKATVTLAENGGAGYDTVKSTVSYTLSDNVERLVLIGKGNIDGTGTTDRNELVGNAAKNHLSGGDGVDTLDGGKGNDHLTGGTNSDRFVFKTGNGHDTITDFSHADGDRIDLRSWTGIDNFQDVKDHAAINSGDLVITVGQDQLILHDTTLQDVKGSDFLF